MFQSYKIVRSIPTRSGRFLEDFSGASRPYRSGQRQTVRGLNSFGLYLEAGNMQHIARAVFRCVKIAFTPGVRNKTRAPVLVRVTSGIKDIINAIFKDYKILFHIRSVLNRSSKVVRATRSPWFSRSAYLANRSPYSFGWVVRATGDPLRVGAVRGRWWSSGAPLRPSTPGAGHPCTLSGVPAVRLAVLVLRP